MIDEVEEFRRRCALELEYRERMGRSYEAFVREVAPEFQWYLHCKRLASVLERVASGELKRLMILMPPRHGKSQQVSRLFSAYWQFRHPSTHVGLASYAADLAHGLSRSALEYYRRAGGKVNEDVSAAREWQTIDGGMMWAAGVGGPITGKGFHLGIIDDPLKNAEEAESVTLRDAQIEWYRTTWSTRREPDAAEILIQTRWHVNDLAGWLLSEEGASEFPQRWHIVCLPALAEELQRFPETCTVEPDWREKGEALCPERYDVDALRRQMALSGSRGAAALYQQRPTIAQGNIWKRPWFRTFKAAEAPDLMNDGLDWDLAYTKDDGNSASAFVRSAVDAMGNVYVTDLGFRYYEFPELIAWMRSFQAPRYVEAKASGKSAVQTLKSEMLHAQEVEVRGGDKVARTQLATPVVESGRVFIEERLLDTLLDDPVQGILKVGVGYGTDLNDAFVQALNRHGKGGLTMIRAREDVALSRSEVAVATAAY